MSEIKVQKIKSIDGGTVEFVNGVSGNADGLRFDPKVVSFSPTPLSTGVDRNLTEVIVTFDQPIQFSGVGTVFVRAGFATGTIYEQYTCGVSTNLLISGETLRIDLTSGTLDGTTNYFVTLPSVGIANTYTQYYKGTEQYFFITSDESFDIQGGDYEQVIADGTSPTGYYKYNIFTTSGIATFSAPSASAESFSYILVAGGGAGGVGAPIDNINDANGGGGGAGGLIKDYNISGFNVGNLTVTIGAGGNGMYYTDTDPTSLVTNANGEDSSLGPTPVGNIVAFGGGRGGVDFNAIPDTNNYYPFVESPIYRAGQTGGSGGGATGNYPAASSPIPKTPPVPSFPGGSALAYPGPNAQGYPGGLTYATPWPTVSYSKCGGGGGGAGGSGQNFIAYNPPTNVTSYRLPTTSAQGGNGASNPEFNSTNLSLINGFPSEIYQVAGPTGLFGGGGGGSVKGYSTKYPTAAESPGSYTSTSCGTGGPGGGGRGAWDSGPPNPFYIGSAIYSEKGVNGTGGGGGGGYMGPPTLGNATPDLAPPTYPFPTTTHGSAPGGSGVFMVRYAHPGS